MTSAVIKLRDHPTGSPRSTRSARGARAGDQVPVGRGDQGLDQPSIASRCRDRRSCRPMSAQPEPQYSRCVAPATATGRSPRRSSKVGRSSSCRRWAVSTVNVHVDAEREVLACGATPRSSWRRSAASRRRTCDRLVGHLAVLDLPAGFSRSSARGARRARSHVASANRRRDFLGETSWGSCRATTRDLRHRRPSAGGQNQLRLPNEMLRCTGRERVSWSRRVEHVAIASRGRLNRSRRVLRRRSTACRSAARA